MVLYGNFNIRCNYSVHEFVPMCDYIEIETQAGETVMISWDEAEWYEDQDSNHTDDINIVFRCKGVEFNDKYANGNGNILLGAKITGIEIFCFDENINPVKLLGVELTFRDGKETYELSGSGCDIYLLIEE